MINLPDLIPTDDKSSQLQNRIVKNYRHLKKWAKRTKTDCFRIYDRDIKEYPLAIDLYAGRFCVHYFSSEKSNDEPPKELEDEINGILQTLFQVPLDLIYWRTRFRRKKEEQYEKSAAEKKKFVGIEHGVKFYINLTDYLDTGLFLDHRDTRQMVAKLAKGKKVLNLFAYTCSFSVHAAAQGAAFTKSVDLSNTYTNWGKDNFLLNELPLASNEIIRADCLKFLKQEKEKYDLIIIDPPTLSRSKKMDQMFDIQKDYVQILKAALNLLLPDGTLFFSTNSRKFTFDESLFKNCFIQDITTKTIPLDFHNKKIHRCWKLKKT